METVDVLIVGGGPAGSTCARFLTRAGAEVVIVDAAEFPRVKLCAGWLSEPVWDTLRIRPTDYPAGLWPWRKCHIYYRGRQYSASQRGYFIRRYEFDDYLLRTSGARLVLGHRVKSVVRDGHTIVVDDRWRAHHIVGAGGTHCPVGRALFPSRPDEPVGVRELEFPLDPAEIAATRIGDDGEPELLLHDDLHGYSWNIAKTSWLNVGAGTVEAKACRAAMDAASDHFFGQGHLPASARAPLSSMKGHSYYLFREDAPDRAARQRAFLVGDALGLAQPMTAEGILPAIVSGRLCAEAISDGGDYAERLRQHPVFADYELITRLMVAGATVYPLTPKPTSAVRSQVSALTARLADSMVASAFAWMFAGKPLPARRLLDRVTARFRRRRSDAAGTPASDSVKG